MHLRDPLEMLAGRHHIVAIHQKERMHAFVKALKRLEIFQCLVPDLGLLAGHQLDVHGREDARGNFVLQFEGIVKCAIELLSPDDLIRNRID